MDLNFNLSLDELIQMKKNKARDDKQAGFRGVVGSDRRRYGRHLGTNRSSNVDRNRGDFGNVSIRNTFSGNNVNIMRGGLSSYGTRYNSRGGGGIGRKPMARHFSPYVNSFKVSIQFFQFVLLNGLL